MKNLSFRKILIPLLILTFFALFLFPKTVWAASIWDALRVGRCAATMDVDCWMTFAGTALENFLYRKATGYDYDALRECTTEGSPTYPCDLGGGGGGGGGGFGYRDGILRGGALGYAVMAFEAIPQTKVPFNMALYINDLKGNTILGGTAYAGIETFFSDYYGAAFEGAVKALWKAFRDIAYAFFAVVMVAAGFMVMFRKQLAPRTTVTVTTVIPRILIGLVLVTFSYPIVALAVSLIEPLFLIVINLSIRVWESVAMEMGPTDYAFLIIKILVGLLTAFVNPFLMFFSLILILVLIFLFLSMLFTMLMRFARLVLMGIFGPLILAWGTIPGQEEMIGNWFKGLIANVLAVPALWAVAEIGLMVMAIPTTYEPSNLPFAVIGADVLATMIKFIIGFMILWQARKVPRMIDSALEASPIWTGAKAPKPKK